MKHRLRMELLCGLAAGTMAGSVAAVTVPAAATGSGHLSRIGPFLTDNGNGTVSPYRSAVEIPDLGVRSGPSHRVARLAHADAGRHIRVHIMDRASDGHPIFPSISFQPFSRIGEDVRQADFYCDESAEPVGTYGQRRQDRDITSIDPRCLPPTGDNEPGPANVEASVLLMSANAQVEPVAKKIPIKPRYARVLCDKYMEGDFRALQRRIQRWWKGRYTLEDIYLSLRCKNYENHDLLRLTPENIGALFSAYQMEEHFRKIAEERGGESLLTKVLYCEFKTWRPAVMRDFFSYLDYQMDHWIIWLKRDDRPDPEIREFIRQFLRIRQLMQTHARDFPFPDPRLALGPSETRDYRRKWCRENFASE